MRRIERIEDDRNGVATYELSNGTRLTVSRDYLREVGIAEAVRRAGFGHLLPTDRVEVIQRGRVIGSLAPDFDPDLIKSISPWYDPRPGDFTRDGDRWIASDKLGDGDLEAVPGFGWRRDE